MENVITEKTLLPISLLVIIAGGIFWLSSMYALANSNEKQITIIKTDLKSDIIRLESKVDRLLERVK
jgi:hypothetical protein